MGLDLHYDDINKPACSLLRITTCTMRHRHPFAISIRMHKAVFLKLAEWNSKLGTWKPRFLAFPALHCGSHRIRLPLSEDHVTELANQQHAA